MPASEARLAGCERAAVLALGSDAMPLFAASHPERTTALVLMQRSDASRR